MKDNNNIIQVLHLLIQELKIPVTQTSIESEVSKHPEPSSLLAISELLNNWLIPNAAYQLTFDQLITAEIDGPFIAFYSKIKIQFVIVNSFGKDNVVLSDQNWNHHSITTEEFKKKYEGSILIAEKDSNSGEAKYKSRSRKEKINKMRTPFIISFACVIFLTFLWVNPSYRATFNWQIFWLTLFKTAGLAVSTLLLLQSVDNSNPLIQKLCGSDSKKNCNAILSSSAAKLTEELSWSEIGFFYFAGTWLVLIFNGNTNAALPLLAILNLVSLPYTFYSIYYQGRVAKEWCIFCCMVQGLLWLEFIPLFHYISHDLPFPGLIPSGQIFIEFSIPVIGWVFVKPLLLKAQQLNPLRSQLQAIKYNSQLFNKLLQEEAKYVLPKDEHVIILGNRSETHTITLVSSPFCQPCSTAHEALEEWLASRNDIKLQILFNTRPIERDYKKIQVAEHLMSIQTNGDEIALKNAVGDWYHQKQKNFESWAKKHPTQEKSFERDLVIQREWCDIVEINSTPTIFINGRRLPKIYRVEDIKYLI
jgi:uncharacterized membrane protein/glutaredoxin